MRAGEEDFVIVDGSGQPDADRSGGGSCEVPLCLPSFYEKNSCLSCPSR